MDKNLFNYDDKPKELSKVITFDSLNIHQKINYKANECSFCGTVYLTKYYYFFRPLFKPITDCLTSNYWWHYQHNSGSGNQIDNYEKRKKLFK